MQQYNKYATVPYEAASNWFGTSLYSLVSSEVYKIFKNFN